MAQRSKSNGIRCLTCKERKIKCDYSLPVCKNCQKSHRTCRQGNAFELSWPGPRSRRALEAPQGASHRWLKNNNRDYHFVNVYRDHIEAPNLLLSEDDAKEPPMFLDQYYHDLLKLNGRVRLGTPPSLYSEVQKMNPGGTDLISYFYYDAADSLPQLDDEPTEFRNLLLRMSLRDDSPSSKAVLYSIFCLSTLIRYGNAYESAQFRDSALKALREASNDESMSVAQVLQHVAAGLLLCRAEIALGHESNVFWALYICNLRTIAGRAFPDPSSVRAVEAADARTLYRYVNYHDVLAQFSLNHWRRPSTQISRLTVNFKGEMREFYCAEPSELLLLQNPGDCMQAEILLLSRILSASKREQAALAYSVDGDYRKITDALEAELDASLSESKQAYADIVNVSESDSEAAAVAVFHIQRHLFQAACWIYFQRTCRHLCGPSPAIDELLDDIFALRHHVTRLGVRVTAFPLFLIGNEATTEERRRCVVDLVHDLQKKPSRRQVCTDGSSGNAIIASVNCLISTAWVQEDLHDDREGYLDYVTKMEWVMTSRDIVPPLV